MNFETFIHLKKLAFHLKNLAYELKCYEARMNFSEAQMFKAMSFFTFRTSAQA